MKWSIHHKSITASTNIDALAGNHGDVFTADFQTEGKGRLDHVWHSSDGKNLIMSVVLNVEEISPQRISTFPLVAGLAVAQGCEKLLNISFGRCLKWPNDVLINERKLSGILCRLNGNLLIVGIGVNVNETVFPDDIVATSIKNLSQSANDIQLKHIRDIILQELGRLYDKWTSHGLAGILKDIKNRDYLKGRVLLLRQTDDDASPVSGLCEGISNDGAIIINGRTFYAGEANILKCPLA